MQAIEIVVIVLCVLIVGGVIAKAIIDKKKGKTSCGCDCAHCSGCGVKRQNNKEDTNKK